MKSKPVYRPLVLDNDARRHMFIAGEGAFAALERLLESSFGLDARILCAPAGHYVFPENQAGVAGGTRRFASEDDLCIALHAELERSGMGAAYYVVGSEAFIWDVSRRLADSCVPASRIRQEAVGETRRIVYCVHCGYLNTGVTTLIHPCKQCGCVLAVRDHFSRPLGAYMGVIDNAETPAGPARPEEGAT